MSEQPTDGSPGNSSSSSVQLIIPPPSKTNENAVASVSAGIENPLNVRNLRDILKYTTQMSAVTTNDSGVIDLTQDEVNDIIEKRKFFKNVLSTMTVNLQEEMNNCINILLDANKVAGDYEYALDVLNEYVEDMDFAMDFQKLGGFQIIPLSLKSSHSAVRAKAAQLIGTLLQNNPYCQEKFIEHTDYTDLLMCLVQDDDEDILVRTKALHAISCLVRLSASIFWKFIDIGGINLIVKALECSIDKLQIKTAFLIFSTCHLDDNISDLYINSGVVEILCSIVKNMEKSFEYVDHELFLSALSELLKMSPNKVKEICANVKDFTVSLSSLHDSEKSGEAEKEKIEWLMDKLVL